MTGRLRTSQAGLDLIKSFEGFRDLAVRLPDGRWTIGYGHVRTAREGLSVSEADAEDLLRRDIAPAEDMVQTAVFAPVSQNQFDALVSLAFNISPVQFRDSDILRALNAGDFITAADGFDDWRSARVNGRLMIVDALVRRRAFEKAMFLEHPAGRPIAPTPVVTPERNGAASQSPVPAERQPASSAAGARPVRAQAQLEVANDLSSQEDVAEAVRRLAERVANNDGRPVSAAQETVQPGAEPSASPIDSARREMAERVKRILDRADAAIAQHQQTQQTGAPATQAAPLTPSVQNQPAQSQPQATIVREGLPDFDAPSERHAAVVNGNGRRLIDDTETYNPGRDPAEIFAEAQRRERYTNGHSGVVLDGAIGRLAPWIAVLILSGLGLAVAFVEMFGAGAGGERTLGAPAVFAVFGLMLVMSLYFISTRRNDLDS